MIACHDKSKPVDSAGVHGFGYFVWRTIQIMDVRNLGYLGSPQGWGNSAGSLGATLQGKAPYPPFKILSKNPSKQSLVRLKWASESI